MTFGLGVGIQRLGSVGVATRAELLAISPGLGTRPTGFVYADATAAFNGVYVWSGTAWSKSRGLPDSLAVLTGIGGTANAITGTLPAHIDPGAVALVLLVPAADNTDEVTLNTVPVLDAAGDPLEAGALVAGRAYLLQVASGSYRVLLNSLSLISDISGLQAALDAKADAAATTAALAGKADAAAVTTALAAKADAAATTSALAGKLNLNASNVGDSTAQAAFRAAIGAIALADVPAGVAPGTVAAFAQSAPPPGWLKANGAAVSRTTYAALFGQIGTGYGAGNGSTTFNLPDMRGEFVRGWDDGRGVDSGRVFGSHQTDAFQGHTHGLYHQNNTAPGGGGPSASAAGPNATGPALTDGTNGTPRTAAETRPRNRALLYCIKV